MPVIRPTINGADLKVFHAEMLTYSVGEPEYTNGYYRPPRSLFPVELDPEIGMRPVSFTLDFMGEDMHQIMLEISNMTARLHKQSDIFLPDGFFYWCVFGSASAPVEKAPWILQTEYSLQGLRHGGRRYIELPAGSGTTDVFIEGNYRTPVVYKITPGAAGAVTVAGITVRNLRAGVPVEIDGIRKKVTEAGANKYGDTDMTLFPALESGPNKITVAGNATVGVEYFPIYM